MLGRESLGVGRVNRILRVHGHSLAEQSGAATNFDAVGRETLERLFPGMTDEGYLQAALGDSQAGLGWKQALDVARPAHLGGLIAAGPRVKAMFKACEVAGLLDAAALEDRLSRRLEAAKISFLANLDEVEKVLAEDFIKRAQDAAEDSWMHAVSRSNQEPEAPSVVREGHEGEEDSSDDLRQRSVRISAPQLQRELSILSDRTKARRLDAELERQGAWHQLERIKGLRHREVSHRWLRNLDTMRGGF